MRMPAPCSYSGFTAARAWLTVAGEAPCSSSERRQPATAASAPRWSRKASACSAACAGSASQAR
ncbi:hypothetical protein [Nonomuraea rubra]